MFRVSKVRQGIERQPGSVWRNCTGLSVAAPAVVADMHQCVNLCSGAPEPLWTQADTLVSVESEDGVTGCCLRAELRKERW